MRLKSLEMVGFKSFAHRTAVELTPGITAVVGPNGCGKSNIVDAIRWAMGEQSAKHLRGHQMDDVIFNGSDGIPATGMAEVSLTFDNEDGRGPVDYGSFSEIMITRRLFRSGESEYAINKTPCRLKDVIELFLGTGVGSKAYSIVEQGRVDELVNSKPEERRAFVEEAAGTSKYKSRKLVAERKLERTQQNLLRVTDIVREIERQIRTMELQAKKAERYRALKVELKDKDMLWAVMQRQAFDEDILQYGARLADAENHLAEHLTSLRSKESESESVRLSLMELEKEISAQQENVYQAKITIQTAEQRIDYDHRSLEQLNQAEIEAAGSLRQLEAKLKSLDQEITELTQAKESFIQLSLFEESFLQEKESQLQKLQSQIRSLGADLDAQKDALIELANDLAYLKNEISSREKRLEELNRDLTTSRDEYSTASQSFDACARKLDDAQRSLEASLDGAKERAIESAQVTAAIQTLSQAKEQQEHRVELLKEEIQQTRSRLLSLEDLQRNYEGYQEGVRAIMLKRQEEDAVNGIYGLVAEVIEAPEPYERALTAVLGDRLQYVIVKGHEEGLEAIAYLKRESSGRGSFIPLQLSRKNVRPLPLGEREVIGPLLERISVKEGYRDVAEYLLSDVVIVKDLQAGLSLWNRNGYFSTLVTPEGEVIDPMGVVTGGSGDSLEASVLAQRRHMRELGVLLSQLETRLESETGEARNLAEQLKAAGANKALLANEMHRLELDRVRIEHERRAAEQESERLRRTIEALVQEQNDLTVALQLLTTEISECHERSETRLQERKTREATLAQKQAEFLDLKKSLEELEAATTQSRIRNAALGEKRENTHLNLENRCNLQHETVEQIESRRAQVDDIMCKRADITDSLSQSEQSLNVARQHLQELESRLHAERERYRGIARQLAEIEESIKELRSLGEVCQEKRNEWQLALAEKKLHLQHLVDNVREKYDEDLLALTLPPAQMDLPREDLLAEIDDLRGRLERMGEVNLAAIGEYEELSSRFHFMNQQKEDLEKSMADLQRTIVKLNRICRLRFKEAFEDINEKFQSIFPRLFRGGKAKLLLTDENDYLETGVDIVVQPPGKKLQSITLLSGGEKALTAVSLLFAIFLTKPSPFCFLDEVDAPLDDANIDRFNDLIKEMSEFSQFVLVTHNKKTMQAAQVLYGITMAEPGISKVVSVRMT